MSRRIDVSDSIGILEVNHKRYLDHNMVTFVEMKGGIKQAQLIKKYTENIADYRLNKEYYLNSAIQQITVGQKAKNFSLAVLLGIGVGGTTFVKSADVSPTSFLNPSSGIAKNATAGAFSALLAIGTSALIYKAMQISAEKPAAADLKHLQAAMERAGFTNEKYDELSADLVKLFHFRECLLLNLGDDGLNLRDDYLARYSTDTDRIESRTFNLAIDVYFHDELNKLFKKAFANIYAIQEEKIENELAEGRLLTWIKKFFENPVTRFQFTQQLQINFMEQCLTFLSTEMSKLSKYANHPYLTSLVVSLFAGAVAMGIGLFPLGLSLGITLGGIVILSICLSAALSYWSLHHIDYLKYERDGTNRLSIKHTIENITTESIRLSRLIKNTVETSKEDIACLNKFTEHGHLNGFLELFVSLNPFVAFKPKELAMGARRRWQSELASRYRHSKGVKIDLTAEIKGLIEKSEKQTFLLQEKLLTIMTKKTNSMASKYASSDLNTYLKNTRKYLLNKKRDQKRDDFIKKFELRDKIREEFLEIVAKVPRNCLQPELPAELVRLYTDDIDLGGLGGLPQDLMTVRELAGIPPDVPVPGQPHPYHDLLLCAENLNIALTQSPNRDSIFIGDTDYRELLGLGKDKQNYSFDFNTTSATIKKFLENSYNFMYSLNLLYPAYRAKGMETPLENCREFYVYRMLLILQLAKLTDPNNLRVSSAVRRDIHEFVLERLGIESSIVFDDVVNQTLFIKRKKDGPKIVYNDKEHLVSDLDWVADAIRLDLAYSSKPITPLKIINHAANEFLIKTNSTMKIIIGIEDASTYLTPELSEDKFNKLKTAIVRTKAFLNYLNENQNIRDSGIRNLYIEQCIGQVQKLLTEAKGLDAFITKNKKTADTTHLKASIQALDQFNAKLERSLPAEVKVEEEKKVAPVAKAKPEPIMKKSFRNRMFKPMTGGLESKGVALEVR